MPPHLAQTTKTSPTPVCWRIFWNEVSLVADADEIPEHGAGVVTLMTLHTAKGLEFPVVFVTGWEDGMFPHMRALDNPTELSEERRLAYVGITRARQRLYVSRAIVRSSWGQPMLNPESRFLREIPQELIDWRRTAPKPSFSAPVSGAGRFGSARPSPTRSGASRRPLLVLQVGDRVTHDKYGLGRVEEVSGVGESAMSLIDFGSSGRVKLMHNHAPCHQALRFRAEREVTAAISRISRPENTFGVVAGSTGVIADAKSPLGEPRHWVHALGAAQEHLEVQVRAGGKATAAHGGDLVACHHALTDADQRGIDVAV